MASARRKLASASAAVPLPEHDAKGERRVRQRRVEPRRLAQLTLGTGEVVALLQGQAEVVVRERVPRIPTDQIGQRRRGRLEVAALQLRHPQIQTHRGLIGVLGEHGFVDGFGFLAASALHQGEAQHVGGLD